MYIILLETQKIYQKNDKTERNKVVFFDKTERNKPMFLDKTERNKPQLSGKNYRLKV